MKYEFKMVMDDGFVFEGDHVAESRTEAFDTISEWANIQARKHGAAGWSEHRFATNRLYTNGDCIVGYVNVWESCNA